MRGRVDSSRHSSSRQLMAALPDNIVKWNKELGFKDMETQGDDRVLTIISITVNLLSIRKREKAF